METALGKRDPASPEKLIGGLLAQLRSHALWDSLAIFVPPLSALLYLLVELHRAAWIEAPAFLALSGVLVAIASLAVVARWRPRAPSATAAARLVDDKAAAKDRFVTLATIEPSRYPPALVARVRREAAALERRVDLKKDFPYRIKRSFYGSLIAALTIVGLFHLFFLMADLYISRLPATAELERLARKMAETERLADLARALGALAAKLEDPAASPVEKQALVQEALKQVQDRQKQEEQSDGGDLLSQAANTLQGLEQGLEKSEQKEPEKGGGGVQSKAPQEGQGEGKKTPGGGGDGQGELNAQLTDEMREGKSAQGDPERAGKEKSKGKQGDGKSSEADRDKGPETTGKAEGSAEEKIGKSKGSEIPSGAPPAERFLRPGEEGKEGLKGARYVTVQLPEAAAEDSAGGGSAGKAAMARPKVPISNVPLPAHVPGAPAEKQPLPLEYRGMIR